jgi:hypothetical protein
LTCKRSSGPSIRSPVPGSLLRHTWFEYRGRRETSWLLIERGEAELCAFDPGFGDDLIVSVDDPVTFARWHLGHIDWATALGSGGVTVAGSRDLRRALRRGTDVRRSELGSRRLVSGDGHIRTRGRRVAYRRRPATRAESQTASTSRAPIGCRCPRSTLYVPLSVPCTGPESAGDSQTPAEESCSAGACRTVSANLVCRPTS